MVKSCVLKIEECHEKHQLHLNPFSICGDFPSVLCGFVCVCSNLITKDLVSAFGSSDHGTLVQGRMSRPNP